MKRKPDLWHRLITLSRIFNYGVKNLMRNAWLSIAAMAVMLVALVIIISTFVLNVTANNAIEELSKNLKVSIYLKDGATKPQLDELESDLRNNEHVAGLEFVSKKAAQQRFTESFQQDSELIEGLSLIGGDTLPASYEVSVTDLSQLQQIEALAKQEKHSSIIDSITLGRTDARRTIDRAASAQSFITRGSIIAAVIFTAISVLIIFNTIRIAIFTRSEEIRSMKLVGATPGFIRGPFLVETAIYGVIAGILAVGIVYSMVLSLGSKIAAQAEFAKTYDFFIDPSTILILFLSTILLGILVGTTSATLAMAKYLRLKHW